MKLTASSSSVTAKVLKAMSVFSGVQAVGILCSIVRSKLIALWIGEVGVGLFAIYNSVIEMMSTATQLNIRQSAVRDISSASRSQLPRIAGVVRWWCVRLGLIGALAMILASPLLSLVSFGSIGSWMPFAVLAIAILMLAYTSGEQAIMQGSGKIQQLAKSTVIGAVIGTVLSIPLYYWLGVGSIIPSILLFAIAGAVVVRFSEDTPSAKAPRSENIAAGRGMLRLGFYLTISSVAATAASYIFLSYLNQSASTATAGLFQAGYTLVIRYTGIIFTALSMEFFPRISRVSDRPHMTSVVVSHELSLILCVLTPLLVLFVAFDQWAVRLLYTEQFLTMLPFVTIGIGAMIFRALSYCMAYVVISRGDGKVYVCTEVLSSVIGLALNITMFSRWSFTGLGVSYVLWYVIYAAMMWGVYHHYGMRLSRKVLWLSVASIIIVGAAIGLKLLLTQ